MRFATINVGTPNGSVQVTKSKTWLDRHIKPQIRNYLYPLQRHQMVEELIRARDSGHRYRASVIAEYINECDEHDFYVEV